MRTWLIIFVAIIAVAAPVWADTISVVAPGDSAWHAFEAPVISGGTAFWNNRSYDGSNHDCNIGYWLSGVGGCDQPSGVGGGFYDNSPHVTPDYLGNTGTRFGFQREGGTASVTVTMETKVTDWGTSNVFGWYGLDSPTLLNPLFGGTHAQTGSVTFVPSGDYGFYLTSKDATYLSDRTVGTPTHFAVFRFSEDHYELAGEDMWWNSDWDYNDLVVDVQFNQVPEPATLLLVGAGVLLGAGGLRRRRDSGD